MIALTSDWVKSGGSFDGNDKGESIGKDTLGNIYGSYKNQANFGDTTLSGGEFEENFIAKFDTIGDIIWVQNIFDVPDKQFKVSNNENLY